MDAGFRPSLTLQLAGTTGPIMSAKEQMVTRARILVAEDHALMRQRVVRLLKRDFDVLGSGDKWSGPP